MNRRLLRETYHVESEEINFTHGIPDILDEKLTGETTSAARDYTHPYGSHYSMKLEGSEGNEGVLYGPPLRTDVVNILEFEAVSICASGPFALEIGLSSLPEASDQALISVVPGSADAENAGSSLIKIQNGETGKSKKQVLFKESDKLNINDIDIGILIDCDAENIKAHIDYSWAEVEGEGFPSGRIVHPVVRGVVLNDSANSFIKVRRLNLTIYS